MFLTQTSTYLTIPTVIKRRHEMNKIKTYVKKAASGINFGLFSTIIENIGYQK